MAQALGEYSNCAVLLRPDRYVAAVLPRTEIRSGLEKLRDMMESTRAEASPSQ